VNPLDLLLLVDIRRRVDAVRATLEPYMRERFATLEPWWSWTASLAVGITIRRCEGLLRRQGGFE
jgi:hypothetical protein